MYPSMLDRSKYMLLVTWQLFYMETDLIYTIRLFVIIHVRNG